VCFSKANIEEIREGLAGLLMSKKYPKWYNGSVSLAGVIVTISPEKYACMNLIGKYTLHRKNIGLLVVKE
jgi:hypothetical protein